MVFTWDWENTCVVYSWWHVKTVQGFIGTLAAIVLISMGYELLRHWIAKWNAQQAAAGASWARSSSARTKLALLYALLVGYSFMLMLVFMTYNGWYMLAVVVGAGAGHYLWGDNETRGMACH